MNISHLLSIVAGVTLLLLSRSVFYKVKKAYHLTFSVLLIGALFTFVKGLDFEEAIILIAVALLLRMSKDEFYRDYIPFTRRTAAVGSSIIILILMLCIFISLSSDSLYSKVIPDTIADKLALSKADLIWQSIFGFGLALITFLLGFRINKNEMIEIEKQPYDEEKILSFLDRNGGNHLAHLIFLKDKHIYWAQDGTVLLAYQKVADKLVVLGDPLGPREKLRDAIEEFQLFANRFGLQAIFYQVNKELLATYHETGYHFFKLGEEARVDLQVFTLAGKQGAKLRTRKNKFIRQGFDFEVVEKSRINDLFGELKQVSDEWLSGRNEKGFSLGFYNEDYIERTPIAVLRDPEGKLIAFASLVPDYNQEKPTVIIDLMRHAKDKPHGTMDMLFISILEWAQGKEYKWCSLGMAPLSNVGITKYSFLCEKTSKFIFNHGSFLYQFKGLREYKSKFAHEWEPKYLAYRKKTLLPLILFQLSLLIGRRKKIQKNCN